MTTLDLNPQEAAKLSQRLRARYEVLTQRSALRTADAMDGTEVHDMKDEASAAALDEVQAADRQRDETEMADIEQALARMHVQTYGACVDCGGAIGLKRLQAYPTAKRCRDCQETHEQAARRPVSH